jgi:hypothetical protein
VKYEFDGERRKISNEKALTRRRANENRPLVK